MGLRATTVMNHRPITSGRIPRLAWAAAAVATVWLVGACSTAPKEEPNTTASIEALYKEARQEASAGANDRAIKLYERLEGRASGTMLAQQALLEQAHLQHRLREKALALNAVDRFIKNYPSSPALDYALFLRGVINFNDNRGFLGSIANQDLSERDQQAQRDAYQAFKQLVEQFPESIYVPEAKLRMDYIVNTLAEHEVHVARYYFQRGAYVAAANRAQQAVAEYPQVPAAEEALYLLSQSYDKLGLEQLRDDARRVLDKNFPNSRYVDGRGGLRNRAWWQLWQ